MTLQELINFHSHPELSEQTGSVYQVWDDGEITLQKCGDLLWQRNLHMMEIGFGYSEKECSWPNFINDHGYIFTDREGAEAVREALGK